MAIQFFCGRPGSGKSYGVIENVVLPALKNNRLVYTNIPLQLEAVIADYPASSDRVIQFTNEQVNGDFLMSIPGGAIIIIDECWRFWPAGTKVTDIPQNDKEFFAEHRHKAGDGGLTQEIVLVSQSPSQIAKYVKDLIDQTVLTTKADKVGLKNQFQVKIYSACIPSIDKPGEPNTTGMGTYKEDVYRYYKSHTKSETGLPGIEIKADKRGSIWGHWYIRYVAPIILIGSIWGASYMYKFFTGDAFDKTKTASVEAQTVQKSNNQSVPVVKAGTSVNPAIQQAVPVESLTRRITAVVDIDGRKIVYVEHSEKRHLMKVGMESCKITLNGLQCQIDNEIVTSYTGQRQEKERQVPTLTQAIVPKV